MEKKVLIIGGSGLVGQRLKWWLESSDYEVYVLSRKPKNLDNKILHWNPVRDEMDEEVFQFPVLINLAGANIAEKRWSTERKKVLWDSRVKSTEFLAEKFKQNRRFPKIYLGASAIGIYGDRADQLLDESSVTGKGFLTDLTRAWEEAHNTLANGAAEMYIIRIGIVLSTLGGALQKSIVPAKLGVASYFGSGKQYFSWIHIDDLCKIMISCIESDQFQPGIYNGVSPNPVTNKAFTKALKKAVNRFAILAPAPAAGLKLLLGEMASIVLDSIRVKSSTLEKASFNFSFPQVDTAIKDILDKSI